MQNELSQGNMMSIKRQYRLMINMMGGKHCWPRAVLFSGLISEEFSKLLILHANAVIIGQYFFKEILSIINLKGHQN